MKKFNFPFAYVPKVSLKDTLIYSSLLRDAIIAYLHKKYNCVHVDPALIATNKQSIFSYIRGDRAISFDNKTNNLILNFNSTQDNYLLLLSNIFKNEHFFTFAPLVKRDAKQSNLDSTINWIVDVELSMPINLNVDYFTSLAKQTFADLINIANDSKLKSIHTLDKSRKNIGNISIIDAQKIENLYPTLSLEEGFILYCSQHKYVIVKDNIKTLASGRTIESFVPTAHDCELSCGLYVYDENNNKPYLLINVCKRPDKAISKEQLMNINPQEIIDDLYDSRIFDEDHPTHISMVINFSNLLFFFLEKIHLAEVVKSAWPDDFLDFVNIEKIDIL